MYKNNAIEDSSDESFTNFSNQINYGKILYEDLRLIREGLKSDPTKNLYCEGVDNMEADASPYIHDDQLRNPTDCYFTRIKSYLKKVYESLDDKKKKGLTQDTIETFVLTNIMYRFFYARKKHVELMKLFARNSLLPIPQVKEVITIDGFEEYKEPTANPPTTTAN